MFKPLHVWSSKEAIGNEEKKMVQNLKWATAHLSIGEARALGARHSTSVRRGMGARRGRWFTGRDAATRPAGRPGRGLCVQAGPSWCTVHLAQF